MNGHIAVHTWSHNYMTTLTNEQIVAELGYTMQIIYEASGKVAAYWVSSLHRQSPEWKLTLGIPCLCRPSQRPPYGDVSWP
jgi:peptidoglycan/xylan/chitin deacetylase (PgdA/CDA1 family)